ncbi:Pyridoxamine 5''-phosphate oxidase [Xenococcus sp. PCC 7305]|uniref:pyridoxamine 5'-phosphate oxidase family protein n=1 Tax=Xenococcus sp. PCC 7305 TaxID=102125 RepID=UPI0002AC4012|nr:pyridoxamine 5'-phosphate oxidase family protein [Xenococcus sp. PCC 7305]ELS02423.1 Pyridoxamine 5''-phosphate oxidase [Xenococcus sp. PCC 7305]
MAQFYSELTTELRDFIAQQKMFFTATAPSQGRINLSPKGIDTFRYIDNKTVAYLDLTGSGNETAAHLQENGRITIMFCSFTQKPLILRLYGQGIVIDFKSDRAATLRPLFTNFPGARQIILLNLESAQTSCGFGVPIYDFQEERQTLITWAKNKGERGIQEYQKQNNLESIDGLPIKLHSSK